MTPLNKVMIWAAVVIAAIALTFAGLAYSTPDSQAPAAGDNGPVMQFQWFTSFIQHGTAVNGHAVKDNWAETVIPLGSNQAAWRNTGSVPVYIDLATLNTQGVASSTYKIYGLGTTSPTIPASNWNTAPIATSTALFAGINFATSSVPTTTNSISAAVAQKGNGVVVILPNQYFITYIQTVDLIACQVAKACEMATSSNRGISTITTRFHYTF